MTIEDVTRAARVSPATVSRALKDSSLISGPTRRRVARAARRLGYVPNQAARSLVTRATRTLGLLIPDVTDPIHGQVVTGFEQEAAAAGYTVIMASGLAEVAHERRALDVFVAHRADGIALMGSVLRQSYVRARVRPTPVVFINGEHPALAGYRADLPRGCIRSDDPDGVRAAVRHLVEAGARRLAYVHGPPLASDRTRYETVRALVHATPGVTVRDYAPAGGIADLSGVLDAIVRDRPDAAICYDDKTALAVLDGLRERGMRVPADMTLVGFDDIPFAALANPRLTTVAQPSIELGRLAARMLAAALQTGRLPRSVLLPVRLAIRESSQRPGRAAGWR